MFREREKQHQREELWSKVESLAARSPAYDLVRAQSNPELNNIATSPEQDDEIILDNLEQEAHEVSTIQFFIFITKITQLRSGQYCENSFQFLRQIE